MCKVIERRRADAGAVYFVVATGDLAFAGKPHEYDLVAAFFDEVAPVAAYGARLPRRANRASA